MKASIYLRGANSPLLHCGRKSTLLILPSTSSPRGEFAPPTLRRHPRRSVRHQQRHLRGANSPLLHCGLTVFHTCGPFLWLRGANSPLLHCGNHQGMPLARTKQLRGSNSPLLHCGPFAITELDALVDLRGANSPLLHCGGRGRRRRSKTSPGSEGRIRPSYIAATAPCASATSAGTSEGRIRPSYIAAANQRLGQRPQAGLRGANSPLLHCGRRADAASSAREAPPRGEFAPPTLRPVAAGRTEIHCGLRGANSPLLHCGAERPQAWAFLGLGSEGRIRPSYIAAAGEGTQWRSTIRLRGANSPLLHCGIYMLF